MNAMNQIIIEGNVVRQPQLRETPRGKKVCVMPIAVNHYYKDNSGKYVDEVGYFDIETWGEKYAPYVEKYALQGRGVRIVGRLKQDRWKDADGKNYSKVKIIAEHIDFKPVKKGDLKNNIDTSTNEQSESFEEDAFEVQQNMKTAAAGVVEETVSENAVF